jgi:hypothetical protein
VFFVNMTKQNELRAARQARPHGAMREHFDVGMYVRLLVDAALWLGLVSPVRARGETRGGGGGFGVCVCERVKLFWKCQRGHGFGVLQTEEGGVGVGWVGA